MKVIHRCTLWTGRNRDVGLKTVLIFPTLQMIHVLIVFLSLQFLIDPRPYYKKKHNSPEKKKIIIIKKKLIRTIKVKKMTVIKKGPCYLNYTALSYFLHHLSFTPISSATPDLEQTVTSLSHKGFKYASTLIKRV